MLQNDKKKQLFTIKKLYIHKTVWKVTMVQSINLGVNYNKKIQSINSDNVNLTMPVVLEKESTNFNGNIQQAEKKIITSDLIKVRRALDKKKLFFHPNFAPKKESDLLSNTLVKKYAPGTRERERNKEILKELQHLAQPLRKRTIYNTNQLKAAGVKESDIKKYLKLDGHVTEEGKRILKEKGKSYK